MANKVVSIDQVVAGRVDWNLKVRVMNLWNVPVRNSPQDIQTIEMVFIDSKNNKIGATVPKSWIPLFIHLLQEGSTYLVENLMVAQNDILYKKTAHKFKLNFMRNTRVCKVAAEDIPHYSFDFSDFATIKAETRSDLIVDVIGHVVQKDSLKEKEKDGRRSILLDLVLEDQLSERLNCTLWGPYARRMNAYLENQSTNLSKEAVVVIIQLARLTKFLGVNSVSSGFYGTKLFINDDIPELSHYTNSLLKGEAGPSHAVEPIIIPLAETLHDELLKTPKMTIAQLIESTKECFGAVLVTVVDINTDKGWSYNSCNKCLKVVSKVDNMFFCESCRANVTASPRFKLHLQVIDTTGSTTFTLFNSLVSSFIGCSAEELIREIEEGQEHVDIPNAFNAFFGKKFLFKVQVADINIRRGWQTYTAKKFTNEETIISEFSQMNKIDNPLEDTDTELQNDLAKLDEDNTVIILDNDTPTKPVTQPLSSEQTPHRKPLRKPLLSSVDSLDVNKLDFSPDLLIVNPTKTPKQEFPDYNGLSQTGEIDCTPPTKSKSKRCVSAIEPINLNEMEVSPESVCKMSKSNHNDEPKE